MKRVLRWWNLFPFVRLLVPFLAGIYFQPILPVRVVLALAGTGILALFLIGKLPVYRQFQLRFIPGISLHVILFAIGSLAAFTHDVRNSRAWFAAQHYDHLILTTISEPRAVKNGYYVDASVVARASQKGWYHASGKLRLRISDTVRLIHSGSILRLAKQARPVENFPGSVFDYQAYLANQNIYHQVKLASAELEILYLEPAPKGFILHLRRNILATLDSSFRNASERSLAKALLVGDRTELEDSIVKAYTDTGVIHVIAISGLHLGLIYGMLIMILKPIKGKRKGKLMANGSIALALWIFTLICGASPSVVRSAVMFTSLLVGDSIGSENNTGNALASSAFLLLCIDPFLIRDIGFQLSYAAVASLLLYNRDISSAYRCENRLLADAWSSISTSISAQILTTPLVLIHFHQFPLVFILSNLVAVPLSGLILLLLILLCLLQALPVFAHSISGATSLLISFLNEQVSRLALLPFSTWKNISWSSLDLIFCYTGILFLTMHFRSRSPKTLIFFLLTILTWLASGKYSI